MATWESEETRYTYAGYAAVGELASEAELLALYYEAHDDVEAIAAYRTQPCGQLLHKCIGCGSPPDGFATVLRVLLTFPTSTIPDTSYIISASLKVLLTKEIFADSEQYFDWYVKLRAGTDLNALSLDLPDMANYSALLTAGWEQESWYVGSLPDDEQTEFNIDIPVNYINKSGFTVFSFLSSDDEDREPPHMPSVEEYVYETVFVGGGYLTYNPCVLLVTYAVGSGYIWTDSDKLHFISGAYEQELLGDDTGTDATAGYLYAGLDDYLYFISRNGDKRQQTGRTTGATGTAGHIWIDDMYIYWVDSSGDVRQAGTFILDCSYLGVDTYLYD